MCAKEEGRRGETGEGRGVGGGKGLTIHLDIYKDKVIITLIRMYKILMTSETECLKGVFTGNLSLNLRLMNFSEFAEI